jgi:hypothetical protein
MRVNAHRNAIQRPQRARVDAPLPLNHSGTVLRKKAPRLSNSREHGDKTRNIAPRWWTLWYVPTSSGLPRPRHPHVSRRMQRFPFCRNHVLKRRRPRSFVGNFLGVQSIKQPWGTPTASALKTVRT